MSDRLRKAARYTITRMAGDPSAPPRYRRSGWMAFDTQHQQHGQVWPTKAEAACEAERLGGGVANVK